MATRPCAAHGRTSARLSETPTPIQPLYNHFPNHPRTAFHPRHGHNQPQLNHNLFTTISPTILQPLSNPAPTIGNLNPSSSVLQPPRNREPITTTPQLFPNHIPTARSRQTDDPALGKHPRLNHPSCRIQERFRHNHSPSVILQIRQRRAAWPWLVHQLPRPSRHFLHHPRPEGDCEAAGNVVMTAAGEP